MEAGDLELADGATQTATEGPREGVDDVRVERALKGERLDGAGQQEGDYRLDGLRRRLKPPRGF